MPRHFSRRCPVSIRSPHRSKGRRFRNTTALPPELWDNVSIRSPHRSKGRRRAAEFGGEGVSFNPLPSPSKGSQLRKIFHPQRFLFQSAPLTEARGDYTPSMFTHTRKLKEFQSAPLTEARGDMFDASAIFGLYLTLLVSIRSPHRSKGRHAATSQVNWKRILPQNLRVSIRSPHRSKGRHVTR